MSYLLWPFYSITLGVFLGKVQTTPGLRQVTRLFLLGATWLLLAALVLPKAIAYFYHYYVPVSQPEEYRRLDRFLQAEAGTHRVLYLAPYFAGFGRNSLGFETSFTWNPNRVAAATPVISSPQPSIGYYHLTYRDWEETLYSQIYPSLPLDLGAGYLSKASVRYLVYHNDIVGGGLQGRRDLARLRNSDLRHVASFGFVHVFENPYPHQVVDALGGKVLEGSLSISKRNPASYVIDFPENVTVPAIVMRQPYDPLWILRQGGDVVAPTARGPLSMRFDLTREQFDRATLEYFPQRFYDQGIRVSAGGIVLVLLALLAVQRSGRHTPKSTEGPTRRRHFRNR